MSTRCPVAGCAGTQQTGKLMCRECWYRVPAKTRRAVNAAWRAYCLNPGLPAIRAYRVVRDEAVAKASLFQAEVQ